jgi:hypothetical protein
MSRRPNFAVNSTMPPLRKYGFAVKTELAVLSRGCPLRIGFCIARDYWWMADNEDRPLDQYFKSLVPFVWPA